MRGMETATMKIIRGAGVFSVFSFFLCLFAIPIAAQQRPASGATTEWAPKRLGEPLLRDPIWVYNDWSAYDELSDNIPLTEALAMKELDEIVRLRKLGMHFDYYM